MSRPVFVLLICLLRFVPSVAGETPPAAAEQALEQISAQAMRAQTGFLASDLLEGRGTGSRGYQLAAKYVATQFELAGLKPAGEQGTYFQQVPLLEVIPEDESSSLVLVSGGERLELEPKKQFLVQGHASHEEASVEAPVVFVGFGVSAPELGYDDYAGVDVRGKIVAMMGGAPARFDASTRAHYASSTLKQANAVKHGAVGIIGIYGPGDRERLPWYRTVRHHGFGKMSWLQAGDVPYRSYPELRVTALLEPDAAKLLFAHAPNSYEQVLEGAAQGHPKSFALGITASLAGKSRHRRVQSPNVVGLLPGTDPVLRNQFVVFTAHLDHMGIGEPVNGDAIYNGALDNASGSAALLLLARAFGSMPKAPRRSLLFLAVTAEEKGLLGAEYFVHHPTVPMEHVVADINMDGAPVIFNMEDTIAFGAEHSTLGEVAGRAAGMLGIRLSDDPVPEQNFFIRSDQYPFIQRGVPALFFTSLSADPKNAETIKHWLVTNYHAPSDDMKQDLNFESAARWAQLGFLTGYLVAEEESRPQWNDGDFFARTFADGR